MPANDRIDLCELGNAKRWDAMIAKVQRAPNGLLTEFEEAFVKDMIRLDMGDRPLWSPTRKQYNFLHTIVSSL